MNISWDAIKYIFQIPLGWFKWVHRRVANAYGSNFIRIIDGYYGGMCIDIDEDSFKAAVENAICADIDLSGYVRSVDQQYPDSSGNVALTGYVKESELQNYVTTSELNSTLNNYVQVDTLQQYVSKPFLAETLTNYVLWSDMTAYVTQDELTAYVTEAELTNYVTQDELDNYVTQSELDNYATIDQLQDYVELQEFEYEMSRVVLSVDGVAPVNGNVDFNFPPNKWMKTDENGHIETTDETPVSLSGETGYLYSNAGVLRFEDKEFVDLSSDQTITGVKQFDNHVYIKNSNNLYFVERNSFNPRLVISMLETAQGGRPSIAMYDSQNSSGIITKTENSLLLTEQKRIGLTAPEIALSAPANDVYLLNQPTETQTDSLAVATCGYVQKNAVTLNKTTYTPRNLTTDIVTNVSWNGTQIVVNKITGLQFVNGVLVNAGTATTAYINTVAYQA